MNGEGRPGNPEAAHQLATSCTHPTERADNPSVTSRQVAWWPVHEFLTALVAQANTTLPAAGTPAWCALADGDPRKLLALAIAGEHHVLRVETAQTARADASQAISAAADWAAIGKQIHQHNSWHAAHPELRRVSQHTTRVRVTHQETHVRVARTA